MPDSLSPYIADYDSPADTRPIRIGSSRRRHDQPAAPVGSHGVKLSAPALGQPVIRSFDAVIEDVNPQKRSVVARINTASRDRFNTVILPRGCRHKNWRAAGGPVLWEHSKDVRRGSDPIATGKELWNNGGPNPTEIIAEPAFLTDDFAQQRYEWVRDGIIRSWSINALPTPGTYGPPSREELRARPDWEDVDTVFRDWDMVEFSLTVRPGNADALTTDHASKVMKMVERGLLWMPEETEPMYREALARTTVAMPGLPEPEPDAIARTTTDSVGGLVGGGATLKPDDDEEEDEDLDEHGKPKKKAKAKLKPGKSIQESGVAAPQPVAKSGEGIDSITRRIVEEDGKFFVLSEDGKKRLGGPYGSRGEAEKRLEQVEYFKHEDKGERSAPEASPVAVPVVRTAPYIDTDEATWTVRRPDGSAIAVYRDATDAEECLRMIEGGASRPFERVLAEMIYEQRTAIDARQEDLIARIELEYFGRLGTDNSPRK